MTIVTGIFGKSKMERNMETESMNNVTSIVDAGSADEGPSIMENRTFGANLDMFQDPTSWSKSEYN